MQYIRRRPPATRATRRLRCAPCLTPPACGALQVRVVYVVLEAQYQSSLSAAVRNLNAKRPDVAYEARAPRRAASRRRA